MKPYEVDVKISFDLDWFNDNLKKIVKRYVKNEDKVQMILIDFERLLILANEE